LIDRELKTRLAMKSIINIVMEIGFSFLLFATIIIIVLYLITSGYDFKLAMKRLTRRNVPIGLIVDVFMIASALILLIINALHLHGGLIQLIMALLVTSILPGHALLNICGMTRYFTRLENIVLSYIMSYVFTGIITLALLPISAEVRTLIILSIFITLGLTSVFRHRECQAAYVSKSLSKSIDSLALIVAIAFYIVCFYFMYPDFALLPGPDIARHYAWSVVLWRTPELYLAFDYLLSHLHESAFIAISNASTPLIQTALVMLNVMMPLAFYAMAKSYLENVDARLPSIATIFYSTFSGFAWIYLAKLIILDKVDVSELRLISTVVNDQTYNGAAYLAQPFLWYVPLSMSFTIFIVQLMLLRKLNIDKKIFMTLFSLLTIASYMTHIAEAVIFAFFISFYAFFSKNKKVRLDDALDASIIGFIFLDSFYIMLQYLACKSLNFTVNLTLLLSTAVLIFIRVYRCFNIQAKLSGLLSKLAIKPLIKSILYIVTFVYILGLVTWIGGVPSFHTQDVVEIGYIPWFIYPVFLGIAGILMLASFHYLFEDIKARGWLILFIAFILFSLVFGKALSFININFFFTRYWESRLTSFFFLSSSVIAPYGIVKVAESVKRHQNKIKSGLAIIILISVIVIYGLQSSFMVMGYWSIAASSPTRRPSQEEQAAINFLNNIFQHDKYAYTITFTRRSYDILTFASPPYELELDWMQVVLTAENPEIPLLSLKARNLSHAYLYVHGRDYEVLNEHCQGWVCRHLIPMLPITYRNNEVTIYNISSVSFPQKSSTTLLVIPFDKSVDPMEGYLYAYDILSLGGFSYTVAYDLDPKALSHRTVVLSFDPPSNNTLGTGFYGDYLDYAETGGHLIVLNTNGYGYFAERMLVRNNLTIKAYKISGKLQSLILPVELVVPAFSPKTEGIEVIASYVSQHGYSAYAVREKVGLGEIIYVNLYPIITIIEHIREKAKFYNLLGKSLQPVEVQLEPFRYTHPPITATFKEVKISGKINVTATSLLFPTRVDFMNLKVIDNSSRTLLINNVTRLQLFDYDNVSIISSNLTLSQGRGFYSNLKFKDCITITFDSRFASAILETEDNNIILLQSIKAIVIETPDQINLYVREPFITAQGSAYFKELYSSGAIYHKIMCCGQDLKINGVITLKTYLSDIYSWASSFDASGTFERDPPILAYNELSSLPQAAYWSLPLVPMFIIVVFLIEKRDRNKRADIQTNNQL